jgi:hypothetical protein
MSQNMKALKLCSDTSGVRVNLCLDVAGTVVAVGKMFIMSDKVLIISATLCCDTGHVIAVTIQYKNGQVLRQCCK